LLIKSEGRKNRFQADKIYISILDQVSESIWTRLSSCSYGHRDLDVFPKVIKLLFISTC